MNEPTLASAIKKAFNSQMANIHTALPGRIERYDHATQKADVKPLIKKAYLDGVSEPLPVVVNVPVVWPQGGGGALTFPLKEGDGVLLVFAERSLETWLSTGGEAEPGDPRKFDLTDAIAIPGLNPFTVPSKAANNTDVQLIFGSTTIKLKENGDVEINASGAVKVTAGGAVNVDGSVIDFGTGTTALIKDTLISLFNSHIHTGVMTGPGVSGVPSVPLTAAVSTTKTKAQ